MQYIFTLLTTLLFATIKSYVKVNFRERNNNNNNNNNNIALI